MKSVAGCVILPFERRWQFLADSNFWSWLAGFSDGEGCFTLSVTNNVFRVKFTIGLRADDWQALLLIQENTQLGTIRFSDINQASRPSANASAKWIVDNIDECLSLRDGLKTVGGLRAKKARDFAIWSDALDLLSEYGGGKHSGAFVRLTALKARLHEVKFFDSQLVEGLRSKLGVGRDGQVTIIRPHGGRGSHDHWMGEKGSAARQWRQLKYAKLTQDQIDEVIRRVNAGERRYLLAKEFGVTPTLITKFMRGDYLKRDGSLERGARTELPHANTPEFWASEAGQRAKRSNATIRSKVSQAQIDEIVTRHAAGETMNALALAFNISRPLVSKFVKGQYVRRD